MLWVLLFVLSIVYLLLAFKDLGLNSLCFSIVSLNFLISITSSIIFSNLKQTQLMISDIFCCEPVAIYIISKTPVITYFNKFNK